MLACILQRSIRYGYDGHAKNQVGRGGDGDAFVGLRSSLFQDTSGGDTLEFKTHILPRDGLLRVIDAVILSKIRQHFTPLDRSRYRSCRSSTTTAVDPTVGSAVVMICCAGSIYIVQLQPKRRVLDRADRTAPTR